MSKPLKAKVKVTFSGVDLYIGDSWPSVQMTAGDAIDLYRSLRANMKKIKKNAKLWDET
jgi:hypothetical protein